MTEQMNTRERFWAVMNFKAFDRLPLIEMFDWWDKTICRWNSEGLNVQIKGRYEICRNFNLEIYKHKWFARPRAVNRPEGVLGRYGTEKDYEKNLKKLFPWPVVDQNQWEKWSELQRRGEIIIWLQLDGFFWFPREVFGVERNLYAFYDEPDLMQCINTDLLEWNMKVIDEVCSICIPDMVSISEDMSYNHGSMISKALFEQFIRPYYEKLLPHLKKLGILTFVDTDGNVHELVDWFNEVGLDGFLPNERQAGVDLEKIRAEYPHMRFIGGFDKTIMSQGEEAMRAEFERLLPVACKGGYIISCDHQTPPEVSLENYKLYLKLLEEYAWKSANRKEE
jgi:hypothetical protein